MPRYIDTEELLKVPNVRKVCEYDETGEFISYKAVPVEAIENVPTVDAVEVVRCKDCRDYSPKSVVTPAYCTAYGAQKDEDDFCSWGERRKENAVD